MFLEQLLDSQYHLAKALLQLLFVDLLHLGTGRDEEGLVEVEDHVHHEALTSDRLGHGRSDWNQVDDAYFVQFVLLLLKSEHEVDELIPFFESELALQRPEQAELLELLRQSTELRFLLLGRIICG